MPLSPEMIEAGRNYRNGLQESARDFFTKVLNTADIQSVLQPDTPLNILVPCAGTFPSYAPFLAAIKQRCNKIGNIRFILVDKNEQDLNLFVSHFFTQDPGVTITTHATDLKAFLESATQKFDIIYFEHPEVDPSALLYERVGLLRSSFPYLRKVVKDTVIIGACKTGLEASQMEKLLYTSLSIQSKITRNPNDSFLKQRFNYAYPIDYAVATSSFFNATSNFSENTLRARCIAIEKDDGWLMMPYVFLSALIYGTGWVTNQNVFSHTLSLFMIFSQFAIHNPGSRQAHTVHIVMCVTQALLLAESIYLNYSDNSDISPSL